MNRQTWTRMVGVLVFAALLLSAACQGSPDPLAAENPGPDVSHAAGEGYIGPAASKGNSGSNGGLLGGGATGGSTEASTSAAAVPSPAAAASPEPVTGS